MTAYLASYDLNIPGKDYRNLIDAINRYDNPCRILKSQWLIQSDKSAAQICKELLAFVDANDELFVCELNQNCSGRLNQETINWLERFHKLPALLPRLFG